MPKWYWTPSLETRMWRSEVGLAIMAKPTPASSINFSNAFLSFTWTRIPGFSANRILTMSCSDNLSRFTSRPPSTLAKHISSNAVIIPPAEMSCPARTNPFWMASCTALNASAKYSLSFIVGTSLPNLFRTCARAEPPNFIVSNEKSI